MATPASPSQAASPCILNRVPRDKLPRVLTHILDKLGSADDTDVFSPEEKQQLCEMLTLASLDDVDAIVALVTRVFVDAAHFGKVNRDHALLRNSSAAPDVLAVVEKAWRKKSKAVAPQIAAKHALDASSAPVLIESNWRLHVEMAQSKLRGLSEPSAIFQLALQDPSAAQRDEKLDLELSHDDLHTLFQHLNAIQATIDARTTAATQANAA